MISRKLNIQTKLFFVSNIFRFVGINASRVIKKIVESNFVGDEKSS